MSSVPGKERKGDAPAVSYLVRFWLEPREANGEPAPFRGYARNLQTGEERYFSDPRRFAEHVLRRLHAARQAEVDATDEAESGRIEGLAG